MDEERLAGPYRATKLWNEATSLFRNGMPLKKHRKHMKNYDYCFTGGEAVNWLHRALQENQHFGKDVTREKTYQLLCKFFHAGIFHNVSRSSLENFKENELYQMSTYSPLRSIQICNLAPLINQNYRSDKVSSSTYSKGLSRKNSRCCASPQSNFMEEIKSRASSNRRKQMEIEEVWKTVVLGRLEAVLGSVNVDDLLPSSQTSGAWIMRNASVINGQALYQSFNRSQLFPRWILAAMKSLIDWPHLGGIPNSSLQYPGFEMDVFKVIKDYFSHLEVPLIACFLYSTFITAYMYVECMESLRASAAYDSSDVEFQSFSLASKSVENLVLNMTSSSDFEDNFSQPQSDCPSVKSGENFKSIEKSFVNNDGTLKSSNKYARSNNNISVNDDYERSASVDTPLIRTHKISSATLPPNSCFETAFTSVSPITRIIPRKRVESVHITEKNWQKSSPYNEFAPVSSVEASCSHVSTPYCTPSNHEVSSYELKPCDKPSGKIKRSHSKVIRRQTDEISHFNNPLKLKTDSCQNISSNYVNYPSSTNMKYSSECNLSHVPHSDQENLNNAHDHNAFELQTKIGTKNPVEGGMSKKLNHMRNKSGGYVNLALSNSFDGLDDFKDFDQPLDDVMDYNTALETLQKLMKCSSWKEEPQLFSETKTVEGDLGNQSVCSASSLSSYHTATSGDQIFLPTTPTSMSHYEIDYNKRAAEGLMKTGALTVEGQQLGVEILQLLLLLLPPVDRYKLHMLLYFMSKIIDNARLVLSDGVSTRSLLLGTFTSSILRPEHNSIGDESHAHRLVDFFVTNHEALFQVPPGLQSEVDSHLAKLPNLDDNVGPSRSSLASCEFISQRYEQPKLTVSEIALSELLDQIIMDEKMRPKEKKRRLKMFKESYPHIYSGRFPSLGKESGSHSKPKGILGFPSFSRLKNNLRI